MISKLRVQNFKSWQDTGEMRLAPLTALFGTNSSGKTALLQLLLMLKQTVESPDRSRVLHTGDERAYVDLGTFYDVIGKHQLPGELAFEVTWSLLKPLRILDPEKEQDQALFSVKELTLAAKIAGTNESISVEEFTYSFIAGRTDYKFGMKRKENLATGKIKESPPKSLEYELIADNYAVKRYQGRPWPLPAPIKTYGFPDQVKAYYQNAGFVSELVLAFEELMRGVYYLGPLREYPHRSYLWAGEQPQDVGLRGELAVPALLATRNWGRVISPGGRKRKQTVEERMAYWLRELGLIHSFSLKPIAENRKDYEVRVQRTPEAPEVLITDVGFGVSQILPVLVLCYYAPPGSTIILEQPEIHLHPSVQAGLADVFIDAMTKRAVQIIVESHSEHLLRRLQRRIAEEYLSSEQAALYFTKIEGGESRLEPLNLDLFGNITNWPENFFGDEMGDLVAMTEATMQRQRAKKDQSL